MGEAFWEPLLENKAKKLGNFWKLSREICLGKFEGKLMPGGAGGPSPGALEFGYPREPARGALGFGTGRPAPGAWDQK